MSLDDVADKILARLEAVGHRGAAPPFALRRAADKARIPEALAALAARRPLDAFERGGERLHVLRHPPVTAAAITRALDRARTSGRTLNTLCDALESPPPAVEPALTALIDDGEVVVQLRGATLYHFTKRYGPPDLESVAEALAARLSAEPERVFLDADLRRDLRRAEKKLARDALEWLEACDRVRRLHQRYRSGGKARQRAFWLHAAPPPALAAPSPPTPDAPDAAPTPDAPDANAAVDVDAPDALALQAPALDHGGDDVHLADQIRDGYRRLRARTGLPFVEVLALAQEAGVALAILRRWLEAGCALGIVRASGTNMTAFSQQEQAAAIEWRGLRCGLVALRDA